MIFNWLPVLKLRRTWRAAETNLEGMRWLAEKALESIERQGEDGIDKARGYLYTILMLETKF